MFNLWCVTSDKSNLKDLFNETENSEENHHNSTNVKNEPSPRKPFLFMELHRVASLSYSTTFISYILRIHVKHTKIVRVSKNFPCLIILALNLARQMYINFTLKDVCSICLIQSYIFDVVCRCGFLGRIYLLDHCSISWCCFPFFKYSP